MISLQAAIITFADTVIRLGITVAVVGAFAVAAILIWRNAGHP